MIQPISINVRQFKITHLAWATISFAVAFAANNAIPIYGRAAIWIVACFWAGMLFLFVSDSIDPRGIDERGWISQVFNLIGILLVAVCSIAAIVFVVGLIVGVLIYFSQSMEIRG